MICTIGLKVLEGFQSLWHSKDKVISNEMNFYIVDKSSEFFPLYNSISVVYDDTHHFLKNLLI